MLVAQLHALASAPVLIEAVDSLTTRLWPNKCPLVIHSLADLHTCTSWAQGCEAGLFLVGWHAYRPVQIYPVTLPLPKKASCKVAASTS